VGPVVMAINALSDTHLVTAYGPESMWLYAAITTTGPKVLRVSDATGTVVQSIRMPELSHAVGVADRGGLWIRDGDQGVQTHSIVVYHVDSHSGRVTSLRNQSLNAVGDWTPPNQDSSPAPLSMDAKGLIVLTPTSVGPITFGTPMTPAVASLGVLLGKARPKTTDFAECGLASIVTWPNFTAYFDHSGFVGYQSANAEYLSLNPKYINAETAAGLRAGDTVADAERIYGAAFSTSSSQGGSWTVQLKNGRLVGLLKNPPVPTGPSDQIADIGAGNFGCPAMGP
jgi:hypothetical protein